MTRQCLIYWRELATDQNEEEIGKLVNSHWNIFTREFNYTNTGDTKCCNKGIMGKLRSGVGPRWYTTRNVGRKSK